MKKQRWIHTTVSAILAAVMLAGCAPAAETEKQEAPVETVMANSVASDAEVFPITQEKYDLRIMAAKDANIEDINTNEFTIEYEDLTNVHVNWELIPSKSTSEKLNLVLGTQEDLPDVFLGMNLSNEQVMTYGVDQKVLIDLTPYIEKYAPNVTRMLEYNPNIRKAVTAPDGGIYALPSCEETLHTRYPQKAWIYKPWLDKLGLEVPTNLSELEAVLTAFRDQDPNGNNKKDEIPLTGATTGWLTIPIDYLMSPFIYTYQKERFNVDAEGNVTAPYATPEWREGLRYMHHLCEEGLMDPQCFVQDQAQLKQLTMIEGENIVGVVTAGAPGGFIAVGHKRQPDWIALPPMADDEGNCITASLELNLGLGKFAITRDCKDPAVAMRWIDYMYSKEGGLRATCGVEGRDWRWAEEGEIGLNGKPGVYTKILYFGKTQNAHWGKMIPDFSPDEQRNGLVDTRPEGEQMLYDVTAKLYLPHAKDMGIRPLFFQPEDVEQIAESLYLINDFVPEAYSKFILGEWDIDDDAQWEEYLANLDSMGLPSLLEHYTDAYKAQYVE